METLYTGTVAPVRYEEWCRLPDYVLETYHDYEHHNILTRTETIHIHSRYISGDLLYTSQDAIICGIRGFSPVREAIAFRQLHRPEYI